LQHTSIPIAERTGRGPGLPVRRRLRDESGAAIVEFALVLPFLVLVFVLMLDFGRAFNYWINTTHLAAEGARLAAVDKVPAGSGSLQDYIRSRAGTEELRDGTSDWIDAPLEVCVDNTGPSEEVGEPVQVTVRTTYHFLPIGNLPIPGVQGHDIGDMQLEGTATMRREVLADNVSAGCG
jgi:Flp pilus assembly pilin Flp